MILTKHMLIILTGGDCMSYRLCYVMLHYVDQHLMGFAGILFGDN